MSVALVAGDAAGAVPQRERRASVRPARSLARRYDRERSCRRGGRRRRPPRADRHPRSRLWQRQRQAGRGPARPPGSKDHLPADLGDFQGREKEIERLIEILTAGGGQAAVSAIGGMGGIGKSALAVHVAHLLADEAPDGRLFVDLGGRTGTPFAAVGAPQPGVSLSPAEAMVKVAALLEPERQVPKAADAAQAAYRAALDGKRVLLLLDNAESARRCARCSTGGRRRRWSWSPRGARSAAPGLGASTSTRCRRTRRGRCCGRPLRHARRVTTSSTCSPLAAGVCRSRCALPAPISPRTRTSARRLPASPRRREKAAASSAGRGRRKPRRLRRPRAQRAPAGRGAAAARGALAPPRGLPGKLRDAAAAAVWDVDAADASSDLGELRRRSMVLRDAADERWRLHDLMRDIAGMPLEGQDAAALAAGLETARARHARHYCGVLGAAERPLPEGRRRRAGGACALRPRAAQHRRRSGLGRDRIEDGRCRCASRG